MNWRFAGSLDRGSRRGWCLGVGGWVGGFALPFVVSGVVAVAVVAVVVVDFDNRWQVQLLQGLRKKGIFSSPPNRSLTRRCALCGPCHSLVPPCDSGPLIGPLRRPLGSCASSRAPLCVSHKSCWRVVTSSLRPLPVRFLGSHPPLSCWGPKTIIALRSTTVVSLREPRSRSSSSVLSLPKHALPRPQLSSHSARNRSSTTTPQPIKKNLLLLLSSTDGWAQARVRTR